jgi:hypothetical protein
MANFIDMDSIILFFSDRINRIVRIFFVSSGNKERKKSDKSCRSCL